MAPKIGNCARCGREFASVWHHRRWSRFCSLACGRTARRSSVSLKCRTCGDEIVRPLNHALLSTERGPFCGFPCYAEWQRLHTRGSNSPTWAGVNYLRIAEEALGRRLPKGSVVHHVNGRGDNSALVICESQAYHMLLHQRKRAFEACGRADWLKCKFCGEYSAPAAFKVEHSSCQPRYRLFRRIVAAQLSDAFATCPQARD